MVASRWLQGSRFFIVSPFPSSLISLRSALGPGNVATLSTLTQRDGERERERERERESGGELIATELLVAAAADIILAPHDSIFGALSGVLAGRQPFVLNPAYWEEERGRREAEPCRPMAHSLGLPEVLIR